MNKIVTFSLIGKNNKNTISQIFESLYSHQVNIQRSQLINMTDSFILHADAEIRHNICINNILNNHSNFVTLNPKKIYYNSNASNYRISIKNSDEPGIIHNTSKILNQKNINIYKMNSYITTAPIAGHNIFNLNSFIYYPNDNLELPKLDDLGYEYKILKINN